MYAQQVSGKSEQKSSEKAITSETAKDTKSARGAANIQRIPVWAMAWGDGLPPGLMSQTKLMVNQTGDVYEQEADQVAEQVMRMTNPDASAPDEEDEEKNSLMRKQTSRLGAHAATDISNAPPIVHEVLNSGGGQPLDATTRAFMEPCFGHDFSGVRVHTDERATESARAVNALAYTVGRDVVFGRGQYGPQSSAGRNLLAHELTHVVQQGFGTRQQAALMKKSGPEEKSSTDPLVGMLKEALAALGEIESNWKTLAKVAEPYELLKPWIAHGNAVVVLIHTHTTTLLDALRTKDFEVVLAYKQVLLADKITYDYIAWHMTFYSNLLALRTEMNKLVDAFDHDKREFTGRANAERLTRQLKGAIDEVRADSDDMLKPIRQFRGVFGGKTAIIITSPANPKDLDLLVQRTASTQKLQKSIQEKVDIINQFLDIASKEGFEQADEAVKEFVKVRNQIRNLSQQLSDLIGGKPQEEQKALPPHEEQKAPPPHEEQKAPPPHEEQKASPPHEEQKAPPSVSEGGPYKDIKDNTKIAPRRDFQSRQKSKIIAANKAKNGGRILSDDPFDPYQVLSESKKSVSRGMGGSPTDPAMATVDHIVPMASGGTNSYGNARVISYDYNNLLRAKGEKRKRK